VVGESLDLGDSRELSGDEFTGGLEVIGIDWDLITGETWLLTVRFSRYVVEVRIGSQLSFFVAWDFPEDTGNWDITKSSCFAVFGVTGSPF
jgi:hypothetical protein